MSTKDFSNKQEQSIAKYLGWNTVVASGARDFHPGDIINREDGWLGECKTHTTSDKDILFKLDVWKKIQEEAMTNGQLKPVLFTDDGSQKLENTWCVTRKIFVDPDNDYTHVPYPYPIQKNIIFSLDKMKEEYSNINYFTLNWIDIYNKVVILPLKLFKELCL